MKNSHPDRRIWLALRLLFAGMNAHAGECSGVTTKAAQSNAGRHESGGTDATTKTPVRYTPANLRSVFSEDELGEASNVQNVHIAGSDKPVKRYNLDVITSIGYRVKSQQGARFR